nr:MULTISPECIES: sulfatase-like hydrolase/transferase [unclassified Vibrio]
MIPLIAAISSFNVCANNVERPNILFVVADDMGYADLSKFGSEVQTSNLDELANQSVIMSNMQAAPACSPTRSMLWTGVDSHKAGLGNMLEEMAPNQQGQPGYEGMINDKVVLISETLQQHGYSTFYTGKWHLSKGDQNRPFDRGFSQTFALNSGGASHYNDMKPAYSPTPDAKAPYSVNGQLIDKLPDDFDYSTQFYADKAIEFIEQAKDRPFFGVISYTAPHWPLQAPDKVVAKYKGNYDQGYEALYKARFDKQKELGLIPSESNYTDRYPEGQAWSELSAEQKKAEIRSMEIYAAMIDQIDHYTGKVIDKLKQLGKYDNTMIVFLSDNGTEGHTLDEIWPMDQFPKIRTTINNTHDFSYANMGKVNSYTLLGPNWGRVTSPGFDMFKGYPQLGGTQVISFIKYPNQDNKGRMVNALTTVKDFVPTVLELTNLTAAHENNIGSDKHQYTGRSLVESDNLGVNNELVITELFGKVSVNDGQWIAVSNLVDDTSNWALFNIENDVSMTVDLSKQRPEVLKKLKLAWEGYQKANNVIIPNWVSGY